jgi:YHS domain-containing protein
MNATVTDPVCGMTIDPAKAVGSSMYDGTTYHFCSRGCETKFDVAPELRRDVRGPRRDGVVLLDRRACGSSVLLLDRRALLLLKHASINGGRHEAQPHTRACNN